MFLDWDADLVSRLMRQCVASRLHLLLLLPSTLEKAHEMAKAAVRKLLAHRAAGNEMRYGASNMLRRGRRERRMCDDEVEEETDDAEESGGNDKESITLSLTGLEPTGKPCGTEWLRTLQ